MIGFSTLPFQNPPHVFSPNSSIKRPAPTREDLERSWHPSSQLGSDVLHSISCSTDEFDRTFKRQRTNDSIDVMHVTKVVDRLRITPDRPRKSPELSPVTTKGGWYTGPLSMGLRHGSGTTKHDDGTEYSGDYVEDVMEGWGRYVFTPVKQMVVNAEGRTMHRLTERVFEGRFCRDLPEGRGCVISTVYDSTECVSVAYDVGYYRGSDKATGEGVRFAYTRVGGGWEEVCTRTENGECTGVKVSRGYGVWICDCLGLDGYPVAPGV